MSLTCIHPDMVAEIAKYLPILSVIRFLSCSKQFWILRRKVLSQFKFLPSLIRSIKHNLLDSAIYIAYQQADWEFIRFCISKGADWRVAFFLYYNNPSFSGLVNVPEKQRVYRGENIFGTAFILEKQIEWHLPVTKRLDVAWSRHPNWPSQVGMPDFYEIAFKLAVKHHRRDIMAVLPWNNEMGLEGAAAGGHMGLLHFFLQEGARNVSNALLQAAKNGHKHAVEILIEKTKGRKILNKGLIAAVQGGQREVAEWFVMKGADNLNEGIKQAADWMYWDIVKLLVRHKTFKVLKAVNPQFQLN